MTQENSAYLPSFTEFHSVSDFIQTLFETACYENASDIHIDPYEHHIDIRFRVDGLMILKYKLPKITLGNLISKIKILAHLRTDEHITAQDGRFSIPISSEKIDVRVSIMPTYYGENAVLRLLKDTFYSITLDELGFSDKDLQAIRNAALSRYGMILTAGPTGSGKTTSLYVLLKYIHTGTQTIITIEDPIEYAIPGIRQVQSSKQFTFAQGLRAIVRQDPDVVMVGEIRDTETARVAINTALTGHLILSSIHTINAAATLPRLLDMGIEPYLITSTIKVIIAQRLIRKICSHCMRLTTISQEFNNQTSFLPHLPPETFIPKPVGCDRCNHTGYKGRIGIYETLVLTDELRSAVMKRLPAHQLHHIARKSGMTTMFEHGLEKVRSGMTSLEEIMSVT